MAVEASLWNRQAQAAPASGPVAPGQGQSDMFMTLLMAQIKNQNPLDPADPAQFVGQLVQMNQMQATQNMLSELKHNSLMLRELQGLALGQQLGRSVLVQSGEAELSGAPLSGRVTVSGEESAVTLTLTGADGRRHAVELGGMSAGEHDVTVDPAKLGLPPGRYQLSVSTASRAPATLEIAGVVGGVRLPVGGGEPVLTLAGLGDFPASSITRLLADHPKRS